MEQVGREQFVSVAKVGIRQTATSSYNNSMSFALTAYFEAAMELASY